MQKTDTYHIPVLKTEVIQSLNINNGKIYLDGTVGGGGHSEAILNSSGDCKLIAIDRDDEALDFSKKRLSKFKDRITFIKDNYKNIPNILKEMNIKVDGILLDLGVSSHQLDDSSRGFSFNEDAELDMRMDKSQDFSAKDVVNNYPEKELVNIFYKYGEEKFSSKIAKNIISNRPINTTAQLKEVISKSIPNYKSTDIIPTIKRIFQAIRIEVNAELEGLYDFIISLADCVNENGRIAIISFHSLEDRAVKTAFNYLSLDCICPSFLPKCVCDKRSSGKVLTKKPITATDEELRKNIRSKPAKLRVFEVTKK